MVPEVHTPHGAGSTHPPWCREYTPTLCRVHTPTMGTREAVCAEV